MAGVYAACLGPTRALTFVAVMYASAHRATERQGGPCSGRRHARGGCSLLCRRAARSRCRAGPRGRPAGLYNAPFQAPAPAPPPAMRADRASPSRIAAPRPRTPIAVAEVGLRQMGLLGVPVAGRPGVVHGSVQRGQRECFASKFAGKEITFIWHALMSMSASARTECTHNEISTRAGPFLHMCDIIYHSTASVGARRGGACWCVHVYFCCAWSRCNHRCSVHTCCSPCHSALK